MEEQEYQSWVQEYAGDIYRFFLRARGLDRQRAEELTHQTFVAAWESHGSFGHRSSPKSWLLGIARNQLRESFRRQQREHRREAPSLTRPTASPEEMLMYKRDFERLSAILEELDDDKREAFYLRYIQEVPLDELAALLDIPKETLRSRLRWARKHVQHLWHEKTKRVAI